MSVSSLHFDLVRLGAAWLRKRGCDVVLAEPWTPRGERPDVIGWNRDGASSIVIEAKVSRKDFQNEWSPTHKDKKEFRYKGGAGSLRYYLAPLAVIPPTRLEEAKIGWGLLVPDRGSIRIYRESARYEPDKQTELEILVRAAASPDYGKQKDPQRSFFFRW